MIKHLMLAALLTVATAAQAACPGDLVSMRVSKLKPGGSMAGFADAARDNARWYAAHGMKDDRFVVAPVYEQSGGEAKPSVTRIATFHVYGSAKQPKPDAAWAAFVAKYQANSSIESTTQVCLPKGSFVAK